MAETRREGIGRLTTALRGRIGGEIETLTSGLSTVDAALTNGDGGKVNKQLQAQVRWLGQLLAGLADTGDLHLHPDRIGFGATVEAVDLDTGADVSFTLMKGSSMDVAADQVSLDSPVGRALTGRGQGDTVVVRTPGGVRRFRIERVTTLLDRFGPESAGGHPGAGAIP